jgi:hypothetical protein
VAWRGETQYFPGGAMHRENHGRLMMGIVVARR